MNIEKHSNIFKNNIIGAFLAAGMAIFLGAGPTGASQEWQLGIRFGPAGNDWAPVSESAAPKAGAKVARAFMGGRQSTWTDLMSKLRRAGRDLNQVSGQGVSSAFGGGGQTSWLDALRSGPADSARGTSACGSVAGALTGQVGTIAEGRCGPLDN